MSIDFAIASALGMTKHANMGVALTRSVAARGAQTAGTAVSANMAKGMSPAMAKRMATPTPTAARPRLTGQPTQPAQPAVGGSKSVGTTTLPAGKPASAPTGTAVPAPAAQTAPAAAAGTQPAHPVMKAVQDYRTAATQRWNKLPEWARHSIIAGGAGGAMGTAGGLALG